ncbi:MAG TPA: plastocyanin/azurin family copper-binding protein [Natronoarchaeum rubrum]|nr:plastocyanin/azurin family copper-binding protein [Natronoarchaeum rubrum]
MKRRAYLAAVGSATAAGLSGCTVLGFGSDGGGDYDIGMSANAFRPDTYEVSVGDTVVWRNTSSRGHSITAYEDNIPEDAEYFATGGHESQSEAEDAWTDSRSGNIQRGETFEHTFEVPGEYGYYCIPHVPQGMDGTIVVTE